MNLSFEASDFFNWLQRQLWPLSHWIVSRIDNESIMNTPKFFSDNLQHWEVIHPKEQKGFRGKHWIFVFQNVAMQYIYYVVCFFFFLKNNKKESLRSEQWCLFSFSCYLQTLVQHLPGGTSLALWQCLAGASGQDHWIWLYQIRTHLRTRIHLNNKHNN